MNPSLPRARRRLTAGMLCALMLWGAPLRADPVEPPLPARMPALTELPLPASLRAQRVMDEGSVQGQPMAMLAVRDDGDCETAITRTRRLWQLRLQAPLLAERAGYWTVLSAAFADGFATLQLQPALDGGCEGFLSRWSGPSLTPTQARAGANALLPGWPAEVRVLRHTLQGPTDRPEGTVTGQSFLSVPRLLTIFRERIAQQGYRVRELVREPGATPQTQSVLVAESARAELLLSLQANASLTDVVFVLRRKSP